MVWSKIRRKIRSLLVYSLYHAMVVCLHLFCRQRASYHLPLLALLCQILRFLLCCYIWKLCSHKRYRTHFRLLCICSFSSCTEISWCKSNTSQLSSAPFCNALPQTRAFPQSLSLEMALCLIHHWYHRLNFSPERVLSLIHHWYHRLFPRKFSAEKVLSLILRYPYWG